MRSKPFLYPSFRRNETQEERQVMEKLVITMKAGKGGKLEVSRAYVEIRADEAAEIIEALLNACQNETGSEVRKYKVRSLAYKMRKIFTMPAKIKREA